MKQTHSHSNSNVLSGVGSFPGKYKNDLCTPAAEIAIGFEYETDYFGAPVTLLFGYDFLALWNVPSYPNNDILEQRFNRFVLHGGYIGVELSL